jgi:hypothetical protein
VFSDVKPPTSVIATCGARSPTFCSHSAPPWIISSFPRLKKEEKSSRKHHGGCGLWTPQPWRHKPWRENGCCHIEKLHKFEALPAKGSRESYCQVKGRGGAAG